VPPIIYRQPKKLPHWLAQIAIASFIWLTFFAFISRLLTAVVSYFLATTIYRQLSVPQKIKDAIFLVKYLLAFAAFVFLVDLSWAKYNYWRYGLHEKRKHPGYSLANTKLAAKVGLPLSDLFKLQQSHYIVKNKETFYVD